MRDEFIFLAQNKHRSFAPLRLSYAFGRLRQRKAASRLMRDIKIIPLISNANNTSLCLSLGKVYTSRLM